MENKFQIGDHVAVDFGYSGKFGGSRITGVHQTKNRFKYDLEIIVKKADPIEEGTEDEVERIYNVGENRIMSRQDWLDYNQSLPEYGVDKTVSTTFYTSEDIPESNPKEEDMTYDVLIDIDGYRKTFRVGFYHTDSKEWALYDSDVEIDLEHMKWTNLPIDR